jgi:hypothetical protein
MARGRLADTVLKDKGFSGGYIGVSYVEMEYAKNEEEYLQQVLSKII